MWAADKCVGDWSIIKLDKNDYFDMILKFICNEHF